MDSIPDTITLCPMVRQELQWATDDIMAVKEYRKGAKKAMETAVHDGQVELQTLAEAADCLATIKSRATDAKNLLDHILELYTAAPPRAGERDE